MERPAAIRHGSSSCAFRNSGTSRGSGLPFLGRLEDDLVVGRHVAGAALGSVPPLPSRAVRGPFRLIGGLGCGLVLGDDLGAGADDADEHRRRHRDPRQCQGGTPPLGLYELCHLRTPFRGAPLLVGRHRKDILDPRRAPAKSRESLCLRCRLLVRNPGSSRDPPAPARCATGRRPSGRCGSCALRRCARS